MQPFSKNSRKLLCCSCCSCSLNKILLSLAFAVSCDLVPHGLMPAVWLWHKLSTRLRSHTITSRSYPEPSRHRDPHQDHSSRCKFWHLRAGCARCCPHTTYETAGSFHRGIRIYPPMSRPWGSNIEPCHPLPPSHRSLLGSWTEVSPWLERKVERRRLRQSTEEHGHRDVRGSSWVHVWCLINTIKQSHLNAPGHYQVGGLNPSEKYDFVNWDDYSHLWENKIHGNQLPPTSYPLGDHSGLPPDLLQIIARHGSTGSTGSTARLSTQQDGNIWQRLNAFRCFQLEQKGRQLIL